ncbi:tRNA (guanosine(46)-N7)-methyltransferase TrmB [Buchnera aphidicola (Ceratoglyphina bambusae)]|uniref:tRNA (guanosine(46)-N7)-methyltransferase TrmB n=1 Tax=Buchnera aphidicola TaxID=9 RepID=UPI0031B83277
MNNNIKKYLKNSFKLCYKNNNIFFSKIKSFVLRRKKLRISYINVIRSYWNRFCINFLYNKINLKKKFNNKNPIIIDVGFGNGRKLYFDVKKNLNINFLGIEVYIKGVIYCLKKCNENGLENLKIIFYDAFKVFKYMILNNSIFKIQIFFPDPWEKKKHKKRRLINLFFLFLLREKLLKDGILHIITDSKDYYKNVKKNIKIIGGFKKFFFISNNKFINKNLFCYTKYEKKAKNVKKSIYNLIYIKT